MTKILMNDQEDCVLIIGIIIIIIEEILKYNIIIIINIEPWRYSSILLLMVCVMICNEDIIGQMTNEPMDEEWLMNINEDY